MSHRKERTLGFATEANVDDLVSYLFNSNVKIIKRMDEQGHLLPEKRPRHVMAALTAINRKNLSREEYLAALNEWIRNSVTREGHKKINRAFTQYWSDIKAGKVNIEIKLATRDRLSQWMVTLKLKSLDAVINHFLPDKRDMMMNNELDSPATNEDN